MAAELLGLVTGYDYAYMVKELLEEILDRKFDLEGYVDIRTTFNCVAKQTPTTEKRLQIDASAIRQSINRSELKFLGWIAGIYNPSDALTGINIPSEKQPLLTVMKTNKLELDVIGWLRTKEKV